MKNFKIEEVEHPFPESLPKGHPKTYMALTWKAPAYSSHINIAYAEDTLRRYSLGKDLTHLEYLEARYTVKQYKKSLTK